MILRIWICSCVCLAAIGCTNSRPGDEWRRFSRDNSREAKRYHFVEPISPEFLQLVAGEHKSTVEAILSGVERRKDNPQDLAKYLEGKKRMDWSLQFNWIDEKAADELKKGGQLYYFKYQKVDQNETYSDFGVLVLREGRIVYRETGGKMTNKLMSD